MEMEDLILQEVHRHTMSLTEVLDTTPATTLSMHQLRRPLRNLDRSLGRLEDFLNESSSRQQSQANASQSADDPSIILGNMKEQQQHHSQPSANSESTALLPLHDQQQQSHSFDNEAYDQIRQDMWTILIRLPVWPCEDICASIVRRTVLVWELVIVDSPDIPAALESLLERILQAPDCLFSVYGLAWVRMANQLRVMGSPGSMSMIILLSPALAYQTMQFLLPTLCGELQRLVNTSTAHTVGSDASESRFVQGLVQLLGWVTQELVSHSISHQQHHLQGKDQTVFSLCEWLVSLSRTNPNGFQQQQQLVSEFLAQITDYTKLLVDYAQDELDQACSYQSVTTNNNIESTVLLQSAIDLILEAYVFVENLQAWEPPEDSAGNMRTLWQTLAQANVSKTDAAYVEHFLPALVRLTQSVLANQTNGVDLSTFIGVFLRLVPYADLWLDAAEIWAHLQSHAPTLRRLIQLVLLTCSSPTCLAEEQMCSRLQELLQQYGNNRNTSMADLYFAGNYTPVIMGSK
eukprot:scaffold32703_cov153-Amphora_coffeaeformis.AAC.2